VVEYDDRRRLLQWGHAFSSVERRVVALSLAPKARLQWGHAFSSVESTKANARHEMVD